MDRILIRILLALPVLALQGCGSSSYVPVEDLGQSGSSMTASKPGGRTYMVVKGDTLFSIALRHDLDYKKLAQANNIQPPYIIRPNDIIYLKEASFGAVAPPPSGSKVTAYPARNPVVVTGVKNTGVTSGKGVKDKQVPPELTTFNNSGGVAAKPAVEPKVVKEPLLSGSAAGWIWPAEGVLLRQFSPQDAFSKGIDIGASEGTPVKAARPGEVVYAGSGLKGYGNLIIIRHDDTYISAYAHNRTIKVKEGQVVRQGETVAELGMTGTQSPKLHFEIRENGKPINPLTLLPAKK